MGSPNRAATPNIHEARRRRSWPWFGILHRRTETPVRTAAFRKKLDTRPVFEAWLQGINRQNMGVDGRLFEIVRLRGGGFQLAVNFDPQSLYST